MSIRIMTAVWEYSESGGTDRLVLLALADIANDEGVCWPSIAHVARKCRVSGRTVQRSIRNLEAIDEVVVVRGGGSSSTAGGTRSNKYRITVHLREDDGTPRHPVTLRQPDGERHGCQGGGDTGDGDGVTPVSPEPSVEPSMNPLVSTMTEEDVENDRLFREEVAAVCEWDTSKLTSSAERTLNLAARDLLKAGAKVEELAPAAVTYRRLFPGTLTPAALGKFWPRLVTDSTPRLPAMSEFERFGISLARREVQECDALQEVAEHFDEETAQDEAMAAWRRTVASCRETG